MSNLLQGLVDCAKQNLVKYGTLTPCLMFFKEELMLGIPRSMISFPDCNAEDNKTRNLIAAGIIAKKMGADLVVYVSDAAFRMIVKPDDFKFNETEAPLSYPKSMRTECIMLTGIHLPSGKTDTIMTPYKGGDGEPVEFLPNALPEGAVFQTRFTELAVEGWDKADSINLGE